MKRTPFHSLHQRAGAKLVPFAGYEMPVQYAGIIDEHRAVRTAVGVFDVSHMGEFYAEGPNAMAFLQSVTVNDVSKLTPGKAQYSALCYEHGGIVDDLIVYMLAERSYMVVVNAANIAKDWEWMSRHRPDGVTFTDRSDETALLAVQGPSSLATLQPLTGVDLAAIPYYHFVRGTLAGTPMIISRTGYTGEPGFELAFDPSSAEAVWEAVFASGAPHGIQPIGLGARDTLRLEMGYCLYGNDIDDTTHPLEAGLGWITKLGKGDFVGRSVLEKAKADGLTRKLVGMVLKEKAVPRHGYPIIVAGAPAGVVTSGTFSPSLEKGIAMGYVPVSAAVPGTTVHIDVRGKHAEAEVVPLPFVKKT